MEFCVRIMLVLGLIVCLTLSLNAQTSDDRLTTDQAIERAYGSVALVLAGRTPGQPPNAVGAAVVDTVLEVGYTFAWDYPFQLKHQNTTIVLLSGKGTGPLSGVAGATSIADELVKIVKPYRATPEVQKNR